MTDQPSLLCVHAHPDDEALFTGGILARYADAGWRTGVVTCTYRPGDLRVAELARSLEILGAGEPRLLGFRDSGSDPNDRIIGSFCSALLDDAVGRLVARLREFRPDIVVTYDAFGTYGHPDHVQAHRVTLAALEAAGAAQLFPEAGTPWRPRSLYQITFPRSVIEQAWPALFDGPAPPSGPGVPGFPDEQVDVRVDVRPWVERKWLALLAHRSETARGAGAARLARLPLPVREELLATEWFIRRALDAPVTASDSLR